MNTRKGVSSNIKEVNSEYESQLEGFLGTSADILISGEGISKLSALSLSALIDKISSYSYEIKATALIRSPYSSFCSGIQQGVKAGCYFDLISVNNSVPNSFAISKFKSKVRFVNQLKSVFGNRIHFHSFENACTHAHGPVGFLLKEFLCQDPSAFKYKNSNKSLSNLFIRIQNEFNLINPAFRNKKLNPDFQRIPLEVDEKLAFSGKFLLTEVEYGLVEEFIKIEIENLHKITGLDFSSRPLRFSEPIFPHSR